jgi:hypothetical protein
MSLIDRDYYQEQVKLNQKPGKNWFWIIIIGIILLSLIIYFIWR